MTIFRDSPQYPISVRFDDGTAEVYADREDIELNLEDFYSDLETESSVTERNGKPVRLVVSMLSLEVLEFDSRTEEKN